MRVAATIWIKELRDTIRDRRTLCAMIVLPVAVYPLLMLGIAKLAMREETKARAHVAAVAVQAADQAPALVGMLRSETLLKVVGAGDAASEVRNKAADVGLVIPEAFEQRIAGGRATQITIIEDSLRSYSQKGVDKVRSVLREYTDEVVKSRLGALRADTAILKPFTTDVRDTATSRQRGGKLLSYILPIFIILWAVMGGIYTAIDVTAGEKERKTLESLLLTPASRRQIVLGKFLAVSTTSIVAVALSMVSLALSTRFMIPPEAAERLSVSVSLMAAVFMLIPGAVIACMFSALLIAVSICAKSSKEAQVYVMPIFSVAYLPALVLTILRDFEPGTLAYAVPVLNTMLLFKELLVGQVNPSHIAVTILSLIAFAAASILLAAWVFGKESLIFRS